MTSKQWQRRYKQNKGLLDRMYNTIRLLSGTVLSRRAELSELETLLADKDRALSEARLRLADAETTVRNLTEQLSNNTMIKELQSENQGLREQIDYMKDSSFSRPEIQVQEPLIHESVQVAKQIYARWDDSRDLIFPALRHCMAKKTDAIFITQNDGRIVDVYPSERPRP